LRIGQLDDSALVARRIGVVRLVVVAAPGYLARNGVPATPADLSHHNCLTYRHERQRSTVWLFTTAEGEQTTVPVEGNLRSDNGLLLRDAALNGAGITILPDFMLGGALADGSLVEILRPYQQNRLGIYAVHTHRRPPLKIRVWLDYLAEHLPD
jgi:DNA-binding transcriptional LysR family regulator